MPKQDGFSLLELLIVTVIILIITAIALPAFHKSQEHGLGREAVVNLRLISAAEQVYRMEHGAFIGCVCTSSANCNAAGGCNTVLKLNLNPLNWRYRVNVAFGLFEVLASRQAGPYSSCIWYLAPGATDPVVGGGTCP